jgi:cytochrome c oxidase subunit III
MSTQAATYPVEQRPDPVKRPKLIADGVIAMLIFVFTEVMLFAGLISAHTIVRSQSIGEMWPPYGQPRLPIEETAVNTAALLLSGIVMLVAQWAYKKESSRAKVPLLIAALLGAFFVYSQGTEWVALLGEGLTLTSSTYGAFFYVIVGAHGLHALAAIAGLGWAWYELYEGRLTAAQLGTVATFWYFVVLVWPVLYLKLYL